jgi:hypothetical protein
MRRRTASTAVPTPNYSAVYCTVYVTADMLCIAALHQMVALLVTAEEVMSQ